MTYKIVSMSVVAVIVAVIVVAAIRSADVSDAQMASDTVTPVVVSVALDCGHFHREHANPQYRQTRWTHSGLHSTEAGPATGYASSSVQASCEAGETHHMVTATPTVVVSPATTPAVSVLPTNAPKPNGESNVSPRGNSNQGGNGVVSTRANEPEVKDAATNTPIPTVSYYATLTPEETEARRQADLRRPSPAPTLTPVPSPTTVPQPKSDNSCNQSHRHGRSVHSHSGKDGHTHGPSSNVSTVNAAVYKPCKR